MSGSPFEMVFQEIPIFVYADADHCHDCSRVTHPEQAIAPSSLSSPTFDVSISLDGAIVTTEAFREVCDDIPGAQFVPLAGAPDVWRFDVDRVVRVDPFASNIRTGPPCVTCGEPRYVVRSGPLHLDPHERVQPGFSRTDVEFGDTADFGSDQPVLLRSHVLLDRDTGRLLKESGLLGIHLIAQPEPDL